MAWAPVLALLSVIAGQDQSSQVRSGDHPLVQTKSEAKVPASPPAPVKKAAATASEKKPVATVRQKEGGLSRTARRRPPTSGDTGVRVRSQAELQKPRSPFLTLPGDAPADRYSPTLGTDGTASDGLERDTTLATGVFFWHPRRGQLFVYVVDCSGSMIDDDRFARATMRAAAQRLRAPDATAFRGDLLQSRLDSRCRAVPGPGRPTRKQRTSCSTGSD